MLRIATLIVLLATHAVALPGEDHWTADPDAPFSRDFARAKAMIDAEYYDGALTVLQRLAQQAPGDPDVFNLLGFAYRKTGDLVRSAPAYERALYLKPDHLGALEYQGELFLATGNLAGAEANLLRLETLCPSPCDETDDLAKAIAAWRASQQ